MGHQAEREEPSLTLNDRVVLAVLREEPAHGFAVARALAAGSDLGRILTLRRPQVYRAIDRLAAVDLLEPVVTEPGDAGPKRTVYRVTEAGVAPLEAWLSTPVDHVRDLRVEFLLKLRLLERLGRGPAPLVEAQRRALGPTLARLTETGGEAGDVVERWRAENARAVGRFLDGWTAGPGSG
jgi:PadR family transcriptional regulator AphA